MLRVVEPAWPLVCSEERYKATSSGKAAMSQCRIDVEAFKLAGVVPPQEQSESSAGAKLTALGSKLKKILKC